MADKKYSWRDRRWKIVEQALKSNPYLYEQLQNLRDNYPQNKIEFEDFLIKKRLPLECKLAIIMKLNHPDLKRDEYLEFIRPPFSYWNAEAGYMGPDYPSPASYFKQLCEHLSKELGTNDFLGIDYRKLDFEALVQLFSGNGTIINFMSYMNISDARDLITEHKEELELLLKYRSESKDKSDLAMLTKSVRKDRNNKDRDELIIGLTEHEHKTAKEIQAILEEKGYDWLDEPNIRQIRRRQRKRNK